MHILYTEGVGFEPTVQALDPYNGLANRRLQPLGHPSNLFATDPLGFLSLRFFL